ncbi:hypothetical protein [Paludisphaera mucosa]|uniref:Uncharacterized protein n=1 Tax=Paludisphaera mucosa TaxID=3030827 RepID=A0ABT6F4M1_9BACT|nr:hypothetical protein [Paludisphaera mucosa]MDG3002521.1 hypothetical protein [Paludisphaera mucosa]
MNDQAESLRRLVRAQRDWKRMTTEPPQPRPASEPAGREPSPGVVWGVGRGRGRGEKRGPD